MAEQDAGPAVPFTRDFFEHEDGIEWTVSRVLGGVLASSPRVDTIRGANVLELGSGLGHLAIRLGGLGATVTACERGRELAKLRARVDAAAAAASKSGDAGKPYPVAVLQCDWGEEHWAAQRDAIVSRGPFDVVVMCELYYDERFHEDLVWTLLAVCAANGDRPITIYSGFKNRPYSLLFLALLHDTGRFDVAPVPDEEVDLLGIESSESDEVFLHVMHYRPA